MSVSGYGALPPISTTDDEIFPPMLDERRKTAYRPSNRFHPTDEAKGNPLMDTAPIAGVLLVLPTLLVWVVWWLWAVNWKRMGPALARGGWAPAVLLLVTSAVVWSRLEPFPCSFGPGTTLPNFAWQLAAMAILAAVALFCGWVQGRLGWGPTEISVEPPVADDDGHAHPH